LTVQKCPTIDDGSDDVEQMPAIQPSLPVTEIGIRMPSIGRGNFQNIYQYKIRTYYNIIFVIFIINLYGFQVISQSIMTVMVSRETLFYFPTSLMHYAFM